MRVTLLAAAILAITALSAGATGALSASQKPKAPNDLKGTWSTSVTLVNAPPGVDAAFQTLNTFVAGGGLLVSSSQSHAAQRSLAHGNCARTGDREYACTFVWFRFDLAGTFVGSQRVRRTMEISQDRTSFQSADTIEVLAPDNTVLATIQGTETGRRLAA
jgi:hypothetical protein